MCSTSAQIGLLSFNFTNPDSAQSLGNSTNTMDITSLRYMNVIYAYCGMSPFTIAKCRLSYTAATPANCRSN